MLHRAFLASLVFLSPAFGEKEISRPAWPVVLHVAEWRQFLAARQQEGAWPAFERYYYKPNSEILSEFLKKIGFDDPIDFLKQELQRLDPASSESLVTLETEKRLKALIESAEAASLNHLEGSKTLAGSIHIWRFFPVFDGMGMILQGKPAVMLNADALARASDNSVRILTAHEIHHAVRCGLLDVHIPANGILQTKTGEHMVLEGLAVAFSEDLYPGLSLHQYFPAYAANPAKMDRALEHEKEIRAALLAAVDKPISDPSVADYFYGANPSDDRSPLRNSAYLVGYRIVREAMKVRTLDQLTRLRAAEILALSR
jgi:uncharacterized protein YjaZ